jgi:transcriptional regulator with XRE-family HTH domain
MLIFSDNLKYLRAKKGKSQREVADDLSITRDRYSKYEENKSDPPLEILQKISRYYHISIDLLLSVEMKTISIEDLLKLDDNRILLPITVDRNQNNYIEIVTHKAKAGYAAGGYADPIFISEQLEHIYLPWLDPNEKYRTFPVDGDSMPPHNSKSYIVGRYVEKLGDVIDGRTYVVITKNQEMVYKRLNKSDKNAFVMQSDNTFYKPYEIGFSDITEIWEYSGSLERENFKPDTFDAASLENVIRKLQTDISDLKGKMS